MDKHLASLGRLCRICGSKITFSGGYRSPKLVTEFKQFIEDQIENDDANIHPRSLCNKCYMKLYKIKKNKTTDLMTTYNFLPHSDDGSCYVCQQKIEISTIESPMTNSALKFGFKVIIYILSLAGLGCWIRTSGEHLYAG